MTQPSGSVAWAAQLTSGGAEDRVRAAHLAVENITPSQMQRLLNDIETHEMNSLPELTEEQRQRLDELRAEKERMGDVRLPEAVTALQSQMSPDELTRFRNELVTQGADKPKLLGDYITRDKWYTLYLDPLDHEKAIAENLDDPGKYYEKRDGSAGYQDSMTQLYENVLNSRDWVFRRMDSTSYGELHDMIEGKLRTDKTTKWSGGKNEITMFPLRHDVISSSPVEQTLLGKQLVHNQVGEGRYPWDKEGQPPHIVYLDEEGKNGPLYLKTNYQEGEAPQLVDAVFAQYYAEVNNANDDMERLEAIGKCVRNLQIVHPFTDYNRRLNNHTILPKLLMEQGFEPVMPVNSNMLFQGGANKRQIAETLMATLKGEPLPKIPGRDDLSENVANRRGGPVAEVVSQLPVTRHSSQFGFEVPSDLSDGSVQSMSSWKNGTTKAVDGNMGSVARAASANSHNGGVATPASQQPHAAASPNQQTPAPALSK